MDKKKKSDYIKLPEAPFKNMSFWHKLKALFTISDLELELKKISTAASHIRLSNMDKPLYTEWKTANAIASGFRASNYVYAAISKIADAASSVRWIVQERKGKSGEWTQIVDHPIEQLLENPNPFFSRQDLIERLTQHLYLAGNAILHIVTASGNTPVELWPINPDAIKPIPNEKKFISGYQFSIDDKADEVVKPEKIIHMMFQDPADPYWGMSPLQAVGKIVDTDVDAIDWWKVSLQNRCIKDGILSFKRVLSTQQWEDIRDQFREQLRGSANARGPIILGEDTTYTPFGMSPAELDFINSRRFTREDILAVFRVPPQVLGISDKSTYANVKEARKIFWIDTVWPFIEGVRASLNKALVPAFGKTNTLRIWLDFSEIDIFVDILAERASAAERYHRMGVPFNTINKVLNLNMPKVETGDLSFIPSNMMAMGKNGTPLYQKPGGSNKILDA